MRLFELIAICIIIYSTVWVSVIIGVKVLRRGNESARKFRTWLLNRRIQQFQHPPFKNLLRLWIAKRFLLTSLTFMLLIIIPAVFLFFLLGMLFITPLLAIFQGLAVGLLIGRFDRRHIVWAVSVGTFEFGYWALSGGLGLFVTAGLLFHEMSLTESFLNALDVFSSGYWIPLAICILGNAFLEPAGPIYWNLTGAISLEVLSQGKYIDNEV